jgi:hypothetical protein
MQLLEQSAGFFRSFGADPDTYFLSARSGLPHGGFP